MKIKVGEVGITEGQGGGFLGEGVQDEIGVGGRWMGRRIEVKAIGRNSKGRREWEG